MRTIISYFIGVILCLGLAIFLAYFVSGKFDDLIYSISRAA